MRSQVVPQHLALQSGVKLHSSSPLPHITREKLHLASASQNSIWEVYTYIQFCFWTCTNAQLFVSLQTAFLSCFALNASCLWPLRMLGNQSGSSFLGLNLEFLPGLSHGHPLQPCSGQPRCWWEPGKPPMQKHQGERVGRKSASLLQHKP